MDIILTGPGWQQSTSLSTIYNNCLESTIHFFWENGRIFSSFLSWVVRHAVPGCVHVKTCVSMWNDTRNLSWVLLSLMEKIKHFYTCFRIFRKGCILAEHGCQVVGVDRLTYL